MIEQLVKKLNTVGGQIRWGIVKELEGDSYGNRDRIEELYAEINLKEGALNFNSLLQV